tara:strand:+ start:5514 stop:6254 length:741 start_codon:yes stop_codon:yes gene_type:complete
MIKFFRKIRQKFLSENKLSKYLLYAFGEIVLVVIGILIALQVNKMSDQDTLLKKEIVYLKEIEKSLSFDLENEIIGAIDYTNKQNKMYNLYKSLVSKYPDSISKDSIYTLIKKWVGPPWQLEINMVVFDNLNSLGIDLISNHELRNEISQVYGNLIPRAVHHNKAHENWNFQNLYPILNDNFIYYENTLTNDQIVYLKTDILTLNQLHIHANHFVSGYIWRLNVLKEKVEPLLGNLRKEIDHLESL